MTGVIAGAIEILLVPRNSRRRCDYIDKSLSEVLWIRRGIRSLVGGVEEREGPQVLTRRRSRAESSIETGDHAV